MSKKQFKVKKKLEKFGLMLSSEPTCYVVIANGGLGNGISVQQISLLLQRHGEIQSIYSSSKNSYACVLFSSTQAAVSAVGHLQGQIVKKKCDNQNKQATIFLFFLTHLAAETTEDGLVTNPNQCGGPPGLVVCEDFFSCEEETILMQNIEKDFAAPPPTCVPEKLKHRAVLHYGYKFRYGSNDVNRGEPLSSHGFPDYVNDLAKRIASLPQVKSMPDQMTVNKYEPGDGISSHIDNPDAFGEVIITVSLGSPIVMEMTCDDQLVSFVVKPRSVILFTEDARYKWAHGIRQKKIDLIETESSGVMPVKRGKRLSITFRKTLDPEDDRQNQCRLAPNLVLPENEKEADCVEKNYVHSVYNNIASHFSQTREKPWPRVVDFLSSLPQHSVVLDVGCGSGRYLNVCPNVAMFGCDYSQSLIEICNSKGCKTFVCDGLNIPTRDSCFDACICIAVLHHLSTKARRYHAIVEMLRTVKPGGVILLYVWAEEQTFNKKHSNYLKTKTSQTTVEFAEKPDLFAQKTYVPIHKNRTDFKQQDVLVPWKLKEDHAKMAEKNQTKDPETFYRYYHVFKQHELENLCGEVLQCRVIDSYYDNGNWAVVLLKTSK